ncbi:MAG: tetratricopeptide repeat protein [Xenococcaceae cyanobacterium]
MMKKDLIKLSISSVVAVVGVMGFWIGMPIAMVEQAMSQVSPQEELAEAERLNQQVEQLYQQGKYNEAIPLAEQALAIRKKVLGDNHPDVAESLNNLAVLYESQGRYTEAEPLYQQALTIRKQQLGDNHPDVAESLNNLAVLYESQGRYSEAETLHKESLAIRKQRLGDNHPNVAQSLNNLAGVYLSQGRYTEAEPLYQQALTIRKQQLGDNHPDVAASLNNLAELYRKQGKYTEAEPLYQQSLAIRQQQLGDNHSDVAASLNNLALLYRNQGRYAEAEPPLQQALAIVKKVLGEEHPFVANSLNNLAALYENQGRYAEAEPLYQQALAIDKKVLGEEHPFVASSLNNLAGLYENQGRYAEAEPLYQQALVILKQALGQEHPWVARNLNNLALLYQAQERYGEAETLYQQALVMNKQLLREENLDVASNLNNLAGLYQSQGRYSEAETLHKESLAIRKQRLGDNHPNVAQSLNNLAGLYQSQGRYAEAEPLYQQALAIRKQQLGDNHPDVAASLNNLAGFYHSQGNTTRTIELLSQGLKIEEYNLSKNLVAGDERQKQDYMRKISGTIDWVISLNLHSVPNNSEATLLALTAIFERKGRILDVLTNSLQILHQRIDVDDHQTQELLTQLIATRTQLANLIFKKPEDFPSPEIYRQQLEDLTDKDKQLADQISRRSAEFRNLSQPITLEAIQQLIPTDAALVELVRYRPFNSKAPQNERWGKPRYAAYIFYQTGKPQAIDLGEAETIDKAVEKLRTYLRNPRVPLKQLKASARELDKMVMQPVRKLLGDTKTILLSPDAALNLIPFEALVDESEQYLVENYQISYLTSGRDLLRLQLQSSSEQPPLVIADPTYQKQGEIIALDSLHRSIDLSQRVFFPLEGTKQEAEAIGQLFSNALILTKTKATENALKQVKNPDFLHIATHGFFLSPPKLQNNDTQTQQSLDNPLFRSGLVLAGVEKRQSGGDDGVFTAYEATLLNLVGTQLVVLSACDTGIGDISAGEGIYGLRRALVIAGSESQLISLWKVEDTATKDLMVTYYELLKSGEGRREALHQIQRDWLEGKKGQKYQHPYYWASFIPSGDWTPMEFSLSE